MMSATIPIVRWPSLPQDHAGSADIKRVPRSEATPQVEHLTAISVLCRTESHLLSRFSDCKLEWSCFSLENRGLAPRSLPNILLNWLAHSLIPPLRFMNCVGLHPSQRCGIPEQ